MTVTKFHSEGHPEQGGHGVEEELSIPRLLEKAQHQGAIRMDTLTAQEQQRVLEWYRREFNRMDPHVRTELLEQWMLGLKLDDREARDYAAQLAPEEKEQLGIWIGRALEPRRYVATFYECWMSLKKQDQETFVKQFAKQDPGSAIMVAPFVNLARVFSKDSDNQEVDVASLITRSLSQSGDLLEHLLNYHETHPEYAQDDIADKKKEPYYHSYSLNPVDRSLTHIAELVDKLHPSVLVPFVDRLLAQKLITEEKVEQLRNLERLYFREQSGLTQEEEARKKQLLRDYFQHKTKKTDTGRNVELYALGGCRRSLHQAKVTTT